MDGRGYRTTLSYKTLATGTKQVQAMEYPDQGRFTFLYDANDRVSAMEDQLGHRATLTWDGSGNRTAVEDPLGNRTSYVYNGAGQITAVINPLSNRWHDGVRFGGRTDRPHRSAGKPHELHATSTGSGVPWRIRSAR